MVLKLPQGDLGFSLVCKLFFNNCLQVLVVEGFNEHLNDNTVFVGDNGIGVCASAAEKGIVAFVFKVAGEGDVAVLIVIFDIFGSGFGNHLSVDSHDGNGVLIFGSYLTEVGKLVYAGGTPGSPEVDDIYFTALCGGDLLFRDAVGSDDIKLRLVAEVADLISHITFEVMLGKGVGAGLKVPVINYCTNKKREHKDNAYKACNKACFFVLSVSFRGGSFFADTLPDYCLCGANASALAASYTLRVPDLLYIHFTVVYTEAAVGAFRHIDLDTEEGNAVEKTVERAQRADETAEHSEDEYACHGDAYEKQEFPRKERAEHCEIAFVHLVGEEHDTAFKGACGADIFTEGGKGSVTESVCNGNDKYEENEHNVFKEGKCSCDGALLKLWCLYFIKKLLNKTEGTEPSADKSSE